MQMGAMSKSSASSLPAVPLHKRGTCMKPKMVSYTLQNMPELTDEQRTKLKRLASLPYSEIDTSDIPEMTEERFKLAVQQGIHRGLYRPVKKQITAKVDADVLEWLKSKG